MIIVNRWIIILWLLTFSMTAYSLGHRRATEHTGRICIEALERIAAAVGAG